ncbi:MAG: hypothetical protein ACJ8E3_08260 [Sphingomicrobium sp.]
MRKLILITGSAVLVSAAPAVAGGPGGLLTGITTAADRTSASQSTRPATANESRGNGLAGCLCSAARGLLGRGASAGHASSLAGSVIGLGSVGRSHGGHGNGQAIGLAGTVSGSARTASSLNVRTSHGHGIGLAGTVSANVSTRLAGRVGFGHRATSVARVANVSILNGAGARNRALVNVSAVNRSGGASGKLANVSLLNRSATRGRSAVNVAALNGSGGTAGRVVNVSLLNRSGTSGRSAINVAALNGAGAGKHRLPGGFRLINGVPCLPDGTPLTGAAATAVMAAVTAKSHGSSGGGGSTGGSTGTGQIGGQPAGASSAAAPGNHSSAADRERNERGGAAIGPRSSTSQVRYLPRHD